MSRAPVFAIAANKIERARGELDRLDVYLAEYDRSGMRNVWSRTSTIAFAVHNIYNGIEDVMSDMAREIDDHLPTGATSHQALLDQMRIDLEGRRPALLDAGLLRELSELKAFRHLVRHHYGIDLVPAKVEATLTLVASALTSFSLAMDRLEQALTFL